MRCKDQRERFAPARQLRSYWASFQITSGLVFENTGVVIKYKEPGSPDEALLIEACAVRISSLEQDLWYRYGQIL